MTCTYHGSSSFSKNVDDKFNLGASNSIWDTTHAVEVHTTELVGLRNNEKKKKRKEHLTQKRGA